MNETLNDSREHRAAGCNNCGGSVAEILNRECFCKTFDRDQFTQILRADALHHDLLITHPQIFSPIAVFISSDQLTAIRNIIGAVERTIRLPAYVQQALIHSHENALFDPGTAGVFMGYDFHLGADGPKLIEINTNAGGAFLNSVLISAQKACCSINDTTLPLVREQIDEQFIKMFFQEWRYQRVDAPLQRIAIVDENPQEQFLYPEFKIAQRLFEANGVAAVIAGQEELMFENGQLTYRGQIIDLVYNRLTDFSLTDTKHQNLFHAYHTGAVVVTPNPHHHAIYADKRNLAVLSDEEMLKRYGVSDSDIAFLKEGIPNTRLVTAENASQLWKERKQLFFKPAMGFGSRATYRGDKLTTRVWDEIQQGQYVAQEQVLPSERGIKVDDEKTSLKMDIRAYVYEGEIQLLAARLYQGQTTNFRTKGGGFAPVFIAS